MAQRRQHESTLQMQQQSKNLHSVRLCRHAQPQSPAHLSADRCEALCDFISRTPGAAGIRGLRLEIQIESKRYWRSWDKALAMAAARLKNLRYAHVDFEQTVDKNQFSHQLIVLMKGFKDIFNITGDAYRDEFMAELLRLVELPLWDARVTLRDYQLMQFIPNDAFQEMFGRMGMGRRQGQAKEAREGLLGRKERERTVRQKACGKV